MKTLTNIFILLCCFILISHCSTTESESNFTIGTVKHLSFEEGFYGIVTDNGESLDPLNLSKEFQTDGKRILFKYVEKKEMASVHMWGMIVEIIEIRELR